MFPVFKAVISQFAGVALIVLLSRSGTLSPLSPFLLACLQGALAAAAAVILRSALWWLPIHIAFMPGIVIASKLGLPTWLYLALFLALTLIYWTSFRTQVPLFLSNRPTVHRLAMWLPDCGNLNVLDVGSGTGTFVRILARLRPDWSIAGIETAPAPFWLSAYLGRGIDNLKLSRGDFWACSLHNYDVIYAFLSPVPMTRLWHKAMKEMRPGALLVSNSFGIPNVAPEHVLQVHDKRQTQLYCYRIPEHSLPKRARKHHEAVRK